MKKNLGTVDRIVRAALGAGLVAYGLFSHSWIGALGAIPLVTALLGFCPLYCPLHLSTVGAGGKCCGGGCCGRGKND